MIATASPQVAYVMKGFPRASEPFISHEVLRLEASGMPLRLFAIRGLSEEKSHPHTHDIRAEITYLPKDPATADTSFTPWLARNLPRFAGRHLWIALRHPLRYASTAMHALHLSVRYRSGFWPSFNRVFFKDFLRAGCIAADVAASDTIRHLHAHFSHGSTTMAMFASQMAGITYSFTAHVKDIYVSRLNPGDLLHRKIRRAAFVVTCSDVNRVYMQRLCPDARHLYTIYHGLDVGEFAPRNGAAREEEPPLVLAVGRVVTKKGFPKLIRACDLLRRRGLSFHCMLVGPPGDDSAAVESLIEELGLSDVVRRRGEASHEELRELYSRAALIVLPCIVASDGDRDGIPNVLVEAMAMGRPVVSTRVSGIPELVQDGENGRLVEPGDAEALAAAIAELLEDPGARARLGVVARRTVQERFDSARTTPVLRELFDRTLVGKGSA
jgi:glycosyltransferase involved in cell wall biosynthesis